MRKLVLLAALTVLVGSGAAAAYKALISPASKTPDSTISIEEVHRQVDVKSLPALDVKDPF
jgi:hypothetical protein